MTKKFLLLAGILFAVILFAVMLFTPAYTMASQNTRTLQPGRTYQFVGNDARVISHVNVSSSERFELVETNARGEVTSFGFSRWRFSVSGTGRATVTPLAPITVTFNSSRLRIYEIEGSALAQVELSQGQSLILRNYSMTGVDVRTDRGGQFDYLVTNHFSEIHGFGRDVRYPQIYIPGGGQAMIAAAGDVTVYFPSAWADDVLVAVVLSHPALVAHPLEAGQAYNLANLGSYALSPGAVAAIGDLMFRYDFAIRGRDGHVVNYGTAAGDNIRIEPGQNITVTPLVDAELIFPYAWDLVIDSGADFPLYYALAPGESLSISNTDGRLGQFVFIRGLDENDDEISYDYVMYYDDELYFATGVSRMRLNIPAGADITLTADAMGSGLAVFVPKIPNIVVAQGYSALYIRRLYPGETIIILSEGDATVQFNADRDSYMDFVLWHENAEHPTDFGRMDTGETVYFSYGDKLILTNPGDNLISIQTLQVWHDEILVIEASSTPALFRQIIEDGQAININNTNRNFNRPLLIEHEQGRLPAGGQFYEYVLTQNRAVVAYGMSGLPGHSVLVNSRIEIAPSRGLAVSVAFPAQWYGRDLRVTQASSPLLHRITLRPGQSITITNLTNNGFDLSNNSRAGGAGFFLGSRQGQRNRGNEVPLHGLINIPAGASQTITASPGVSLEIWMPRAWARELRLL